MKRLLIFLLLAIPALAQTSKNGRVQVGPYAIGPGAPIACSPSDQWNTTDGHGAYICITVNVWQQIGSGGTNYQVIETAGVPLTTEPKLNFVNIPCVDNPGNTSTDCTASYQIVLNNASALPQEPRINCVPPLSCVDNAANTRTDLNCPSAVGVGGSHSSGCVPDPGAVGSTTDYLGRDMLYHTSGSASTVKPDPTAGIQYVASICNGGGACSDANDGLSWGTAKLTPYAALLALPGGGNSPPQAGHGIVYVSSDPINGIAFGGPAPNQGWWMFGSTDPNYAGGLSGWMRAPANNLNVTLECASPTSGMIHDWGAACLEFWGGTADSVHPAIWLNGFSGQAVVRGFGFNFRSNPIKLGVDSNGNRSNLNTGVSSVWLDKMNVNMGACYSGQLAGPAVDIASNTFWVKLSDSSYSGCVTQDYSISSITRASNVVTVTLTASGTGDIFSGNYIVIRNVTDKTFNGAYVLTSASGTSATFAQVGPNATSSGGQLFPYGAAAIGIKGGNGPGFIYVENTAVNDGGIWAEGGGNGVGLSANRIIYEGDFSHPDMPVIEILPTVSGLDSTVYINDVQYADNTVPICGVENTGIGNVSAQNTTVCGSVNVFNAGSVDINVAGTRQGQTGEVGFLQRPLAPYSVRFPNLAGPSSTWTLSGTTITTGQIAPDGSNNATLITNATGSSQRVFLASNNTGQVVGQTIVFGAWVRSTLALAPNSVKYANNENGSGAGTYCQGNYLSGQGAAQVFSTGPPINSGDGEWNFYSGICKIFAVGTQNTGFLEITVPNATPVYVYGPVLTLIPAGTISDNEAYSVFTNLQSYPNTASTGDVATNPGLHFRTDDVALNPIVAPSGATGTTHVYMDSTANWPSFKPNNNTPYIVPGFTGTWTAGQCATATATVNVFNLGTCGSGGGGNVTNALLNSFAIYTNPGTSNQIGGVAGPLTPANVPQFITYTPNGTVSGAPSASLAGIPVRTNSSNSDAIVATDRNSLVAETFAGSTAVSISSGLYTSGFAFKLAENSSNVNASITLTPSTGTCNGAATCTLLAGEFATVTLDATGTNILADIHNPTITAGSGILITPGQYSWSLSAPGAVGATGSPLASELTCWSAPTIITNCNLSGDATTTNTAVVTVGKVNGTTYPAGGALTTNTVPVVTGVAAVTYEAVPAAAIVGSGVTTVNGQSCTIGSSCNANAGAAAHGIALNEGNGSAISGIAALTVNQIPVGVASADPVAGNLSELSATLYSAGGGGDTGTVMTGCSTPAAAALHQGQVIEFKAHVANSVGTPTLNWCGTGAVTITSFGTTLNVADITTSQNALLMYDTVTPSFQLLNPQTNKIATPPTWDAILSAANNATFNNAGFTTTFNQTSNVNWVWANTTASTNSTVQPAPQFNLRGTFCTVATTCGSTNDTWTIRQALTTALNPPSTLVISQSGSTGFAAVQVPNLVDVGTLTATAITGSGAGTFSAAGASAVPGLSVTGAPYTAGNGTTDTPQLYINAGTAPTTWSTSGTEFGINTPNAFTGNLLDARVNGGSSVFSVNYQGNGTLAGTLSAGNTTVSLLTVTGATNKQVVLSGSAPIDFPEHLVIPAANCNAGASAAGWSIPSSNAPTVACRAGTNNLGGVLQWANNNTTTNAQFTFQLPFDWDTATQPYWNIIYGSGANTSGTVKWTISSACTKSDGSVSDDPAFVAETTSTGKTMATANRMWSENAQFANITSGNNCVAGSTVILKITSGNGTATSTVNVAQMTVTVPRLITQQAN